jgi:hypothetical protein
MGYSALYSRWSWPTFQRCVLHPSSGWPSLYSPPWEREIPRIFPLTRETSVTRFQNEAKYSFWILIRS